MRSFSFSSWSNHNHDIHPQCGMTIDLLRCWNVLTSQKGLLFIRFDLGGCMLSKFLLMHFHIKTCSSRLFSNSHYNMRNNCYNNYIPADHTTYTFHLIANMFNLYLRSFVWCGAVNINLCTTVVPIDINSVVVPHKTCPRAYCFFLGVNLI